MQIVKPEPTNAHKVAVVKEAFEKRYGKDQETRTPEQWRNLVGIYGMETVCKTEKMKEKEVKKKMKQCRISTT